MTVLTAEERLAIRTEYTRRIKAATREMDAAERVYRDKVRARDDVLIQAHGEKKDGKLSYTELAESAGISKGRVIQIVQPQKPSNGR